MFNGWVAALPALAGVRGFRQQYKSAWARGEDLLDAIRSFGYTLRQPVGPQPTNVHHVIMSEEKAASAVESAAAQEIYCHDWSDGALQIQINTSILNKPIDEVASIFAI